jgi:predicted DsbA family dithiol-disulfide isomerase
MFRRAMQPPQPKKLQIDVWSDIACPWCWVGKRRLEAALDRFAHADEVSVTWHAFELDRSAPPASSGAGNHASALAKKYGMSLAQAEAAMARLTSVAKGDGLEMRFDRIRPGNTFDAHRLVHLASLHGLQDQMKERLFRAYLGEGEAMSDRATLVRLAAEVGLDEAEVRNALETNAFAEDVRADEQEASDAGVSGVPFFVLQSKYAISGAQPADLFVEALERAWSEVDEAPADQGEVCGPDGCAVPNL